MCTKISFFNHKGGVSKTTTTFHVGWMLAEKGKRVLLVDTDSQCNLSLMVLGDDNYTTFYEENPNRNIKSGLSAAFDSKPELIKPIECVQVKMNANLLLLPGSFEITEYETQLGVSFQLTNTFTTMKNLPGSFNYLIEKTAEKYDAEIVLIDMNPSLSAINQALIISSDYFIIPTSPDYFSNMAIQSLSRIISNWEKWAIEARQMFEEATYPLPLTTPKFLGYTINDFNIRNNKPTQSFQSIINTIEKTVNEKMATLFKKANLLLPDYLYGNTYCLAQISNFATLQAKSQSNGVPVFALSDKQLESSGFSLTNQSDMRNKFYETYSELVDKILIRINYGQRY